MVQLLRSTVTSINVDVLAQLVAEKAISQRMMEVGQEIIILGRIASLLSSLIVGI